MTDQELFDKVSSHLLTQNARSINDLCICQYFGPDRLKCAAGCLIDPESYTPAWENYKVSDIPNYLRVFNINPGQTELLLALQCVHDYESVEDWKQELSHVANQFGLTAVIAGAGKY